MPDGTAAHRTDIIASQSRSLQMTMGRRKGKPGRSRRVFVLDRRYGGPESEVQINQSINSHIDGRK